MPRLARQKKEDAIFHVMARSISEVDLFKIVEAKALAVLLMRSLCNLKCSEICRVLGNITQNRVSKLSSLGVKLLDKEKYKNITYEFMEQYA